MSICKECGEEVKICMGHFCKGGFVSCVLEDADSFQTIADETERVDKLKQELYEEHVKNQIKYG